EEPTGVLRSNIFSPTAENRCGRISLWDVWFGTGSPEGGRRGSERLTESCSEVATGFAAGQGCRAQCKERSWTRRRARAPMAGEAGTGSPLALHRYDAYFGETGGCECQSPVRPGKPVLGGWPSRGTVFESGPVTIGYTRCKPTTEAPGTDVRSGS